MIDVDCAYCGSPIEPYGNEENFEAPIPCVSCHKSTWVSIDKGQLLESQKWPIK